MEVITIIFDLLQPRSVPEALSMLAEHNGQARVLAGGTDLIVLMKHKKAKAKYLVSLSAIPGLDEIKSEPGVGLSLGAMVTYSQVESSPVISERFRPLAEAAAECAGPQIRNLGTIAGNLCNASPAADMPPALLALGATVKLEGPKGARLVPLEEFFVGYRTTLLGPDELLTEVFVPEQPPHTGGSYLKLGPRKYDDIAIVADAAVVTLEGPGGRCTECRIGLESVAPVPLRARNAENEVKGHVITEEVIRRAAEAAAQECTPIADLRGSAEYRREMVNVFVRRTLSIARDRASASGGRPAR